MGKDVQYYIDSALVGFMDTDPNSFLVITFDSFDYTVEKAKPYPHVVFSPEAVDYKNDKGVLKYLIEKRIVEIDGKKYDQYVYYAPYVSYIVTKLPDDKLYMEGLETFIVETKGRYAVESFDHQIPYTPAIRIGFVPDIKTKGRTCLVVWDAAIPYLRKTIKVNSELDLTSTTASPCRTTRS